jgi:hypothetical protein
MASSRSSSGPSTAYVPPYKRGSWQPNQPSENQARPKGRVTNPFPRPSEPTGTHIQRKLARPDWTWDALEENNWAVGVFAFLPYKADRVSRIRCIQPHCGRRHGHDLETNAQEHPVVILSVSEELPGDTELMLNCVMTSSNPQPYGRGDDGRFVKSRSFPLKGTNHTILKDSWEYSVEHTLEVSAMPKKQSFVLSDHIYRVPFSELQCWYDSEDRLTEESYKRLMSLVGLRCAEWHSFTPATMRIAPGWWEKGTSVNPMMLSTIKNLRALNVDSCRVPSKSILDKLASFEAWRVTY